MTKYIQLLLIFCVSQYIQAQFEFSGNVSDNFSNATAYLITIDDYNKIDLFITEQIIQESKIDSLGKFIFKGDFLASENKFYKIYIDNCNTEITDYNHLLNQCDDSNSIIFIANNSDKIYFPLNDLSQMFCSMKFTRLQNIAISKIDSVQESLLINLHDTKSDGQRKVIYKNYFQKLKKYSQSFNEPLIELYTYHIYSDNKSFTRPYYLTDIKHSDYYTNLLKRLKQKYPKSDYSQQFQQDLAKDKVQFKNNKTSFWIPILATLLAISILLNMLFIKQKIKKKKTVDYKTILSAQEQKVFELMHQKLANKEIAEQLFISVSTVKTHINSIYTKLSISSRKDISHFF